MIFGQLLRFANGLPPKSHINVCRAAVLFLLICVFSAPFVGAVIGQTVNKYGEPDPLVLYEDNFSFWSYGGYANGTVGVSIAASTSNTQSGNSSLQIKVSPGQYAYIEVGHDFRTSQNWSSYSYLSFWFLGSNSNNTVEVALRAPTNGDQFFETFLDNSAAWKHFELSLGSMHTIGNANLSAVNEIGFFFFSAPGTFYVDSVLLETSLSPSHSPVPSGESSPHPTASPASSPSAPTQSPESTPRFTQTPSATSTPSLAPNPTLTPIATTTPVQFPTSSSLSPSSSPTSAVDPSLPSSPIPTIYPSQEVARSAFSGLEIWVLVGMGLAALCVVSALILRKRKSSDLRRK